MAASSSSAYTLGGKRQRASIAASTRGADQAQEEVDLILDTSDSELVSYLLKEWAWGGLSSTKVQEIAHQAHKGEVSLLKRLGLSKDLANRTLRHVAKMGNWGKCSGNCHRDLTRWLGEPDMPEPMMHPVPLLCKKQRQKEANTKIMEERLVDQPIFLPHVVFAHYFSTDKTRFEELFLGGYNTAGARESFWSEVENREDPRLTNHPLKKVASWKQNIIPLAFHGDGVPVLQVGKTNTKSLDVLSSL